MRRIQNYTDQEAPINNQELGSKSLQLLSATFTGDSALDKINLLF